MEIHLCQLSINRIIKVFNQIYSSQLLNRITVYSKYNTSTPLDTRYVCTQHCTTMYTTHTQTHTMVNVLFHCFIACVYNIATWLEMSFYTVCLIIYEYVHCIVHTPLSVSVRVCCLSLSESAACWHSKFERWPQTSDWYISILILLNFIQKCLNQIFAISF